MPGGDQANAQAHAAPQGRVRCRDVLRKVIYMGIFLTVVWLEQALNLILLVGLIALVLGLLWLSIFVALSTSFLWLPVCLICTPLLTTVALLLRYTRLRDLCSTLRVKLQSEPLKSKLWSQGFLYIGQK